MHINSLSEEAGTFPSMNSIYLTLRKCLVSNCRILPFTLTMMGNHWKAFDIMNSKDIFLDSKLDVDSRGQG